MPNDILGDCTRSDGSASSSGLSPTQSQSIVPTTRRDTYLLELDEDAELIGAAILQLEGEI